IASCSLTRPTPVKQMFLIEAPAPAAAVTPQSQLTARIGTVTVAAPYRARADDRRGGRERARAVRRVRQGDPARRAARGGAHDRRVRRLAVRRQPRSEGARGRA